MSNYYDYRDVKVMIAHKLMALDGWKVYGYHPDRSDSMIDYYAPASWDGVAEKNGYILCVNIHKASGQQEIREYNRRAFIYDRGIAEKINKLKEMTVERGAAEGEAKNALRMIENLQKKAEENEENKDKYTVVDVIPGHMAHPSRCNWHIEKDGMIIAKGNGILKYKDVYNYYNYSSYMEDLNMYKKDKKAYAEKHTQDLLLKGYYTDEETAKRAGEQHIKELEKDIKLMDQFESLINKIDTTCGGLIGDGDGVRYEKITVTEYKKELKAVETISGEIKEGQLFILKTNFNYGHNKGQVFRIHESEYNGKKYFHAYKLNGKKTKECTGMADSSNRWNTFNENFLKWIEQGYISWCELKEVQIPYEVEKVVKRVIKAKKRRAASTETVENPQDIDVNNFTYKVTEDTDTRDNSKIYLVKAAEKLSREEYIAVNKYIQSLGGYYSKFKKAFLFKEDPTDKLNTAATGTTEETTEDKQVDKKQETTLDPQKETISYTITEDEHTQTGQKIWILKLERELSKTDFAEVKRKLATIQGYYSSFKNGFIFKYNPEEVLKTG